ncbi:Ribosome control protein 1 [Lasiodiplodia theobromae]|uniref:Guanine nucleotide exchange factor subunit ric1 n=1 Tax=Lasiodiplodia theobromae TaxID=45133 RepID=A0A5N5DIZ2_9PEZI|nr:Ribosome control protein 1 [Lasiodiplodia theobromae]KAB2577530.1 Guanine nucleotide exchange factor subunit ric1 [Lasiodiplodia theobromae]KAF4540509.1 Ribosome control protein 1 [Lasiodiplodia theobromae]KAF9640293.1 Ribosome control protein 1 [Lasiodiplodia theobromae]
MFWPIGSPRVYATSQRQLPPERRITSDDGVNNEAPPAAVNGKHHEPDHARAAQQKPRDDSAEHDATVTQGPNGSAPQTSTATNGSLQGTDAEADIDGEIIALRVARSGQLFATITRSTLTIWQTKPTAVLASVLRSPTSLKTYGPNVSLLLRPDSAIFVVQTALGYLITYSLASDPNSRVYRQHFDPNAHGHSRRQSISGSRLHATGDRFAGPGEGGGIQDVSVRFRMVIRVDAGIAKALALDDELVVATAKPAAIQCIRWAPDSHGNQTSTELLSKMSWLSKKTTVVDIVNDRPMNLYAWVMSDGKAYAVQKLPPGSAEAQSPKALFKGYCFHEPETEDTYAVKAAINARFSLIAVGCENGEIHVYTARDYDGHVPLSHKLQTGLTSASSGRLTFLTYSPDGYCLFAGYEKGWMMWSVYGKPGASSFTSTRFMSENNEERWLLSVRDGFWIGGGSEILLLGKNDNRLWLLEMARSAVAGCYSSANVSRSLLQTNAGFMIYRGYDMPDLTAISAEVSLWHHVQVPAPYLIDQWPIRSAVISSDGRYVAVAGRRGLAHYSITSGRWKTFDDPEMENEFAVRGGMCWHQHVLIAAVEAGNSYELRIYSREKELDNNKIMHKEQLPAPIVLIAPSGDDSLLVYTYENILYHYIINVANSSVRIMQVGQIALHGIIRAPPRVRALSWILPEDQLDHGDPSQDVAVATILFLVDGKLVLLQPTTTEDGMLKYEMRIIAQNVEYYALMRDHPSFKIADDEDYLPPSPSAALPNNSLQGHDLRDSLWYFDGQDMKLWTDAQDVLVSASMELGRELPATVSIPVDFYPLSPLLNKGILFGVESELVQRRDISFAYFRFATRTHLFLPPLLRHHLAQYNSPAALHLSHHYQHLLYFPHALEILLHDVLDDEVDTSPPPEQALLPSVLSFLSSFPQYLDIVVQCTRKTEVRSWRTLFAHLPPPQELFEESLQRGSLKTAGGYLLVLHTFEELSSSSHQLIRLLQRAKLEQDYDLCKELARFLMALDETGETLREALEMAELKSPTEGGTKRPAAGSFMFEESRLSISRNNGRNGEGGVGDIGIGIGGIDLSNSSVGSHSPASAVTNGDGKASTHDGGSNDDFFTSGFG